MDLFYTIAFLTFVYAQYVHLCVYTCSVNLINVNDPPVVLLDGIRSTAVTYDEGSGPTGISATLTVADPDNTTLNG